MIESVSPPEADRVAEVMLEQEEYGKGACGVASARYDAGEPHFGRLLHEQAKHTEHILPGARHRPFRYSSAGFQRMPAMLTDAYSIPDREGSFSYGEKVPAASRSC